ncbi:hypothetical protein JCM3766R1_006210 [Sporobolomyces carnicolor]
MRSSRYSERGDSGSSSDTASGSDSSEQNYRKYPRPRSRSAQQAPPSRSGLTCFLGVALGIGLFAVGGYALWTYISKNPSGGSSPASSNAPPATVTVTEGGDKPSATSATNSDGSSAPATSSTSKPGSNSSSSSNSTSGASTSSPITLSGLARNNIGIGFLPDYTNQDMTKITDGLGIKSSFYGWYAQLPESDEWDGGQLLSQMDDLKACNCIFQPAVMPTKGWKGLTKDDNFQALAIAKVMKQFTDEGIDVQLRFAHEVNWYQEDGTYKGDAKDFKEGWAAVAAAVADNPKVRMFFTPNVAGALEDYVAFMPDDLSTVHLLGIDYYPQKKTESFVDHMKPLYDKYCADGKILFAIGETGNGWEGPIEDRLTWLDQCTSPETAKAIPHYIGVSWFNYLKEREFRLFIEDEADVNDASKKWIADMDGVTQSGSTAGNA